MKHRGVCVGGPYAGKWLEGEGFQSLIPILDPTLPPVVSDATEKAVSYSYFTYVWREPNGRGCWIPSEWTMDEVLRELLAGYHPSV